MAMFKREGLQIRELPKVIDYLKKEYLDNPTFTGKPRDAVEWTMRFLRGDYVEGIYEERKDDQEYNLTKGFEDINAPMNCNNGENLDKYEMYCEENFERELPESVPGCSDQYDRVKKAVELNTL